MRGRCRRNKLSQLEDVLVNPNLLAGLFSHSVATLWADIHRMSRRELPSWCALGPTCQSQDAGSWGTASGASPQTPTPLWPSPPSACTLGCPWCQTSKQAPYAESQILRECWGMTYTFKKIAPIKNTVVQKKMSRYRYEYNFFVQKVLWIKKIFYLIFLVHIFSTWNFLD